MIRGTFANVRIRNRLAPGTEGGVTVHQPSGEQMSIYEAAERYRAEGVPLVVLAGKEYGSGSSRDWAAKGTALLGVRAVIAESFERIHRSNLIGMGVLPAAVRRRRHVGATWDSTPSAWPRPRSRSGAWRAPSRRRCSAPGCRWRRGRGGAGPVARLDTPMEAAYYHHGGILQYVLRQHLADRRSRLAGRCHRGRPVRGRRARKARPRWLRACFSASVISANVRPSPSTGTMTGS